ncbi:uncharacterized protein TRAVEDRAFT_58792 [Trametes versicolor FP-101664 SS1]|uniref:uncharacterized protein n=1 Tax=Trametes versicolor (strain FP-101664) TaxID=717944 RepID=UPI000462171C|nr:uncharacterized protein TRAVEDRAFT_58792 [Trametes versicolor FP-101664 SS1]EIW58629.1 hypothetical protein TRAVEDRAFT_58792 [Trametes versicolor FP-101664 SS1]
MTSLHPLKARFPLVSLPPRLLPCPRIGSPSSAFTKRIYYYIHEYVLLPFSEWYMKHFKIASPMGIFQLPFGLILKRHDRVHEHEGLAMNLARAMGVPAPRFVSFGSLGVPSACPSLLMTRLPGYPLDWFDPGQVDMDVVAADLTRILARMRSFASPHGAAVCGVTGREIRGPMIPGSPLAPFADEDAFNARLRAFVTNVRMELITEGVKPENMDAALGDHRARAETVEKCLIAQAPHAIVFTHGDLNMHNIMIGPDGHVCGIIDWEGGAWLPEYWEFSITAVMPTLPWGQFMDKKVSGGVYEQELKGHQALFMYVANSFSY